MVDTSAPTTAKPRRERVVEYHPPEPVQTAPIWRWPPAPARLFKWIFGFPGFLWPWNALYLAIAVVTWQFLTPSLATMCTLEPGWIALVLLRNAGLIVLVAGAWHLRLYALKAQGTEYKYSGRWLAKDNNNFLFRDQLLDNLFWTFASAVPIWTAYEVLTLWAMANGTIPALDFWASPVYSIGLLVFIPIFREFHFYCIHRLIHWPPLYRTVHKLHHNNINPGPWSGLSMHPVEHVLYFSGVLLHWIVPSAPVHAIFHLFHLAFSPSQGHNGFDQVVLKDGTTMSVDNYNHYLHHRYFEVNYGDGLVPLDKLFGTFHDGTKEAHERMNRRFLKKGQPDA